MHNPQSNPPPDTAPRKRGRRTEDPGGVRKEARIVLFLTAEDRQRVIDAARDSGLSISKFVLACIRKDRGFRETGEP